MFSDGKMVNDVLKVLALLEDDRREKISPVPRSQIYSRSGAALLLQVFD